MGKYCAVYGCTTSSSRRERNRASTHSFPKETVDPHRRRLWIKFVNQTRKNFKLVDSSHCICSKHFTEDCFEHPEITLAKQTAGFRPKTSIKSDAVPSISGTTTSSRPNHSSTCASETEAVIINEKSARSKRIHIRGVKKELNVLKRHLSTVTDISTAHGNETDSVEQSFQDDALTDVVFQAPSSTFIPPSSLPTSTTQEIPPETPHTFSLLPPTSSSAKPRCIVKVAILEKQQPKKTECGAQVSLTERRPNRRSKAIGVNLLPPASGQLSAVSVTSTAIQCDIWTTEPVHPPLTSSSPIKVAQILDMSANSNSSLMDVAMDSDDDFYPTSESSSTSINTADCTSELEDMPQLNFEDRKYIVFRSSLASLFKTCQVCHSKGLVNFDENGTLVKVSFVCQCCGHQFVWMSQPHMGQIPVGNLLLSASVLFTGSVQSKIFSFLDTLNVARISRSTFFYHQKNYLQPTVVNVWLQHQASLVKDLKLMEGGLILAGDGRSDSPGHCAKYGGFNTMECRLNKVIDVQVVQSNEVGNSARCENEGMQRMFAFLADKNLQADVIITDRHKQNEKYLREKQANTAHYFDVWHVAKGLTKKLTQLANKSGMEGIGDWRKSVINHLHWVASSTPSGNGDIMLAKWESITNHVANQHCGHSEAFPTCQHEELSDAERQEKAWFQPDSDEYTALCKVLESKYLKKDVKKLSPLHQTSTLEAFHSLILRFCPKHTSFSWLGMYCRLFLAALHYNENSDREFLVDDDGAPKLKVIFPKAKKGEYSVRRLKESATYKYVSTLLNHLFKCYSEDPAALRASLPERFRDKPNDLSANYEHPTAEEARATYTARFSC